MVYLLRVVLALSLLLSGQVYAVDPSCSASVGKSNAGGPLLTQTLTGTPQQIFSQSSGIWPLTDVVSGVTSVRNLWSGLVKVSSIKYSYDFFVVANGVSDNAHHTGFITAACTCSTGFFDVATGVCGTCPVGFVSQNGQCMPSQNSSCPVGQSPAGLPGVRGSSNLVGFIQSNPPSTFCTAGCVFSASNCSAGTTDDGSRAAVACVAGTGVGEACSGQAVPNGVGGTGPSGTSCGPNESYGTVNGVGVCLPSGGPSQQTANGSTSKTVSNADGSTTTTATTTNTSCTAAGACTTTTTTTVLNTTAAGAQTSTTSLETKQADESTFCAQNPSSVICKENRSAFGGSCGGFSCEGDAVQCAIARDQYNRNCTLFDTPTALSDKGNVAASGVEDTSGAVLSSAASRSVVDLQSSLDSSKSIAAGCIADRSYAVAGMTLVIPFSSLCPYLAFMGQIVLAFAFLSAARLVGVV